MIFERLGFQIDIAKLREHFRTHVLPLPSVGLPTMFGGWSVLSSNGSYKDGWHSGHAPKIEGASPEEQRRAMEEAVRNAKPNKAFVQPTEICHSYMQEVIDKIVAANLYPSRARIIRLCANTTTFKHRDHTDLGYAVRLHLPIITNEHCFFETEGEKAHLPADGSLYLIHVNRIHWVSNHGTSDRYHLVMDVRDLGEVTNHHRYDEKKYPDSAFIMDEIPIRS